MTSFVTAAIAAALLAGAPASLDTVFLSTGGRLRGTVVEEDPARGVSIQIPGGELRRLLPGDVVRIEYGDGSVRRLGEPSPGAPEPLPAQPPAALPDAALPPAEPLPPYAYPPPGPAPRPAGPRPPAGFTAAAGLIWLSPGGDAEAGLPMQDFTSSMLGLELEAGLRLAGHYVLGAFLDVAGGSAGPELKAWCTRNGLDCSTADVKLGLMGRYAFTPEAPHTAWAGLGIAFDVLMALDASTDKTPSYGGGELVRLSAGWDWRGNGTFGAGLFGTFATSRYPDVDRATGDIVAIEHRARHTWLELGVRAILLP